MFSWSPMAALKPMAVPGVSTMLPPSDTNVPATSLSAVFVNRLFDTIVLPMLTVPRLREMPAPVVNDRLKAIVSLINRRVPSLRIPPPAAF